jgi:diguanylate cyclase (GGDEF)-like protein
MRHDADLELQTPASTDLLTGVGTRAGFDQTLDEAWRRHLESRAPLTVVVMDVDSLKSYNAKLGRAAGDECLREVALAVRVVVRGLGGAVARHGGGAFAAILPETNRVSAARAARAVAEGLCARGLTHPSSPASPLVTLSIGCATVVPDDDASPGLLVDQAEWALATAKTAGRNRVVQYPS